MSPGKAQERMEGESGRGTDLPVLLLVDSEDGSSDVLDVGSEVSAEVLLCASAVSALPEAELSNEVGSVTAVDAASDGLRLGDSDCGSDCDAPSSPLSDTDGSDETLVSV